MIEQLKQFINRNKADNQHIKFGWHERLQAIYVHHHQLKPSGLKNFQTKGHFGQSEKSAIEKTE